MKYLRGTLAGLMAITTGMLSDMPNKTDMYAIQLNIPKQNRAIVRQLKYDQYTENLLKKISGLPENIQTHEKTVDYLEKIVQDKRTNNEEISGLNKIDHDDDGLSYEQEESFGTNPLKPNPYVKYAIDNGLSDYIEHVKYMDKNNIQDENKKASLELAIKISQSEISQKVKEKNIIYVLSDLSDKATDFEGIYKQLSALFEKGLNDMLEFGLDDDVIKYLTIISSLSDKAFAKYALEKKLCIEDHKLTELEKNFLREPEKYKKELFDLYISESPQPIYEVITEEDILDEFGINVVGEIWDKNNSRGKKIGDYQPTEDQLHIVYNILSSLPSRFLEDIKGITLVPTGTPGAGGLFTGEVVVIGIPDLEESAYTARKSYISVIYHEIGHSIDSFLLPEEKNIFDELNTRSEMLADYASLHGSNNRLEDFATMFKAYTSDTGTLLERTKDSSILEEKLKFMTNLFSHWIEDKRVAYTYKVEADGTIIRTEVKVGSNNGLPVLTEDISQKEWHYFSRANPKIEDIEAIENIIFSSKL